MANATTSKPASTGSSEKTFGPRFEFTLWKPNKDGKGAAAIFQFSPARDDKEASFWLTMMPETGNESGPKFDKDKSLRAKLGSTDIGEILAVIRGRTKGLGKKNESGYWSGLFHKNASGDSTVITLNQGNTEGGNYFLGLSADRGGTKTRLSISVTPGEMELLGEFCSCYLPDMFRS